jgi:UDP-2,3-diacylglucosamine hydrolase
MINFKLFAMKAIFISDLHLDENSLAKNNTLLQYLENWQGKVAALYILGDFFDYWLGDDDDNAFIRQIKLSFRKFSQTTPIYFIGGNHDFALGKKFAEQSGITILKDCSTIHLDDKPFLISHGDIFCSLDINYQRLKNILQNPITIFLLTKTPLSFRRKIKNRLEKKSNDCYNPKNSKIYNVVDRTIAKYIIDKNVTGVIHGHTHNPGYYSVKASGQLVPRIELPDWAGSNTGGYLMYDNGNFEFKYGVI